jgi:hypothetical protein
MLCTKVVNGSNQIQPDLQGQRLSRQGASPANQTRQARPKGRIQAFDISGIDHSAVLSLLQHSSDLCQRALNHMAGHTDHMPLSILFNDLSNQDVIPESPMGSPALMAFMDRFSKNFSDGRHIGAEAIDTQQHGPTPSTPANQLEQRDNESSIALGADDTAQPQTGLNLQRHGDPDNAALFLDAQFIGLDLAQVSQSFDQMRMDRFTLLTRTDLPRVHGSFIHFKGGHNRRHRTAMGQQRHHLSHQRLLRPQAIESRARRFSKSLLARMANVAMFFLTVNADITLAALASCRTLRIRAKYWVRVHSVLHLIGKVR